MTNTEEHIILAHKLLLEADCIIIGAGAGLSSAAGLEYAGDAFEKEFKDFIGRYHFTDLYTSSFHDFTIEEERWAYWSKHVMFARIAPPALPLYRRLMKFVEGKDYFVITTNVDGQFRKAGCDENRLFEVQGDYKYIQSISGADNVRFDAEDLFEKMCKMQSGCRIPSSLVPRYRNGEVVLGGDGEPMDINIRKSDAFVEDGFWHRQAKNYSEFVQASVQKRLVLLELGVGFNTPTIIRFPFEQMALRFPHTALMRFNKDYPEAGSEMENFFGFNDIEVLFSL